MERRARLLAVVLIGFMIPIDVLKASVLHDEARVLQEEIAMSRNELIELIRNFPVAEEAAVFLRLRDVLAEEAVAVLSRLDPNAILGLLCHATPKQETPTPMIPADSKPATTAQEPPADEPAQEQETRPFDDSSTNWESVEEQDASETTASPVPEMGTLEWYEWKKRQRKLAGHP